MKQQLKRYLPAAVVNAARAILYKYYSQFKGRPAKDVFTSIYEKNHWQSDESVSGRGSDLSQTKTLLDAIGPLLRELKVSTMLDIPCGDFNWMRFVDLSEVAYTGADIVEPLIGRNLAQFPQHQFKVLDMIENPLPKVDLIFCRDALVHLSYSDIHKSIANFKSSGSRYLLTTTYPGRKNFDMPTGEWRPLNLQAKPFTFPEPLALINENSTEAGGEFNDKSMALWDLAAL